MDMVAVDPKLFITCRLCLEEMGQYQIVPTVQQQIKYCFDINVELFDGLPQLICVRCKDILSDYSTTKKKFNEKQDNLKQNLLVKKEAQVEPQQDTVSSTQSQQENINQTKVSVTKKRILRLSSSSDSDSHLSCNANKHKKKKKVARTPITWESDYRKEIICRFCNSRWTTTRSITCHFRRTHETLSHKYGHILNSYCAVLLDKLDDKPNITGLSNMVVLNNRKIIQSNCFYYIQYSKISNVDASEESFDKTVHSDYSDEDEINVKHKAQKKRRLLSRSSNDTVVLESQGNKVLSDEETTEDTHIKNHTSNIAPCINIVDTTDSESGDQNKDESSQKLIPKKIVEPHLDDYKTIQGIISTCIFNYRKKKDDLQTKQPHKVESKLKHIILSIGRKIIHNKQGINCMGLLRYMEQKNLEIQWITRTYFNKSVNNNFVRIFTKLKVPTKTTDGGWVNVYPTAESNTFMIEKQTTDNPALHSELIASGSDTKNKLLNANPVANPKQLPKKLAQSNESRLSKNITISNDETQARESNSNITVVPNNTSFIIGSNDSSLYMPIITSTTSLAEFTNKEQSEAVEKSNIPTSEVNTPRIKVKPVSELMPQTGLNNFMAGQIRPVANNSLLLSQLSLPLQNPLNIIRPSLMPMSSGEITSPQAQIVQEPNSDVASTYQPMSPLPTTSDTAQENGDYLILDTVELPNTKTFSPFQYFRNLLQLHNLLLLDANDMLSPQFDCLVKFKVIFKQETKDQPVVLCLSLFCLRNMFCLKVRDIDVYKISANWQWEILQTYTGEVVTKLLQNAQKTGQDTYDNTNNFICLLKSIKLIKSD